MAPTLDFIGLVVNDMSASLGFYRLLGLEIPDSADDQPHVEVPISDGMRLAWDTVEVVRSFSEWDAPSGSHRIALAFSCDEPAEVDRYHDLLIEAGHQSHTPPFDAVWHQRYASVLDPDGNVVDLYAPLP